MEEMVLSSRTVFEGRILKLRVDSGEIRDAKTPLGLLLLET